VSVLDVATAAMDGTMLVEASAGTGKTHAIAGLYVRLVVERGLDVSRILVVTFTRAATVELRERIRSRIDEELRRKQRERSARNAEHAQAYTRLLAASRRFDEAAIFTIHGWCQHVLQEFAFECAGAFGLELLADQRPLVRELVRDFWSERLSECPRALVDQLVSERSSPAMLLSLAERAVEANEADVLPTKQAVALEPSLEVCAQMRARFSIGWRQHSEQVFALLAGSALSRRNYTTDKLQTLFTSVTKDLTDTDAPGLLQRVPKFLHLTTTVLKQATKTGATTPTHPLIELCDEFVQREQRLADVLASACVQFKRELVNFVRSELPRRKLAANRQSYTDLVQRVSEALVREQGPQLAERLRERFPAALIDEFQDTDPVQYRVFRSIYGTGNALLCLIGDPKQGIYAFRGADIYAYLQASRDAHRCYALNVNWRSSPSLLSAMNALFARRPEAFRIADIRYVAAEAAPGACDRVSSSDDEPCPAMRMLFVPRCEATGCDARRRMITKDWANRFLADAIAGEIVCLLTSGTTIDGRAVGPSDIAVLMRTNDQAGAMQRALRVRNVPSVLQSDVSVLDSQEANELAIVLRALANPRRVNLVKAALATELLGYRASSLVELDVNELEIDAWLASFHEWHETWTRQGFFQVFRAVLERFDVQARLARSVGGDRSMANLLHLGELLHEEERDGRLGMFALLAWFDEMRTEDERRSELSRERTQLRRETDAPAVTLVTIHKSKGLEYPIVFCPRLWDDFDRREPWVWFHDPEDSHRRKLDVGSDAWDSHREQACDEARAEAMRLTYVALTRAKHMVYLVWGAFNGALESPLGTLLAPMGIADPNDEQLLAELRDIQRSSNGTVEVRPLALELRNQLVPGASRLEPMRARIRVRTNIEPRRVTSFSRLVWGPHEDRDFDPVAVAAPDVLGSTPTVPLADFPAGPDTGKLVHSLLESLDFTCVDPEIFEHVASRMLIRHGVDTKWSPALQTALSQMLDTPLCSDGQSFTLRSIGRRARVDELEFTFPVGSEAHMHMPALARAFGYDGPESWLGRYAERVARLQWSPFSGFLRGFIDLLVRVDERFYVMDYKSNLLGPRYEDYDLECLKRVMIEHDYVLQYHIYTLAVDRYLRARMPDWSYERDFGGVYYLFCRGMHPDGSAGVFFDKPSVGLLARLDQAFSGAA